MLIRRKETNCSLIMLAMTKKTKEQQVRVFNQTKFATKNGNATSFIRRLKIAATNQKVSRGDTRFTRS